MDSWLITGGTGFLGRALTAALIRRGASRICIYSRGEHQQALMRREFSADGDVHPALRFFIGDVRDAERLKFAARDCDGLIHAAALKRVEVGEYNPTEMVATNVLGTINAIRACEATGVRKMVLVSSDKACAPLNCYGATKMVAEKLVIGAQQMTGVHAVKYAVVRYGNVANSTGSVIENWRKPGPHYITSPLATRFWLTREGAVELVLHAFDCMRGGEQFVPDLPAYTLKDLAKAMGVDPIITGLGDGEKAHEVMVSDDEAHLYEKQGGYWVRGGLPGGQHEKLTGKLSSLHARNLTASKLRSLLEEL